MEYVHPTDEKTSIKMVPYSAEYREQYTIRYNESFHEMREALHIEPYDFIRDDSFFETGMDVVYLLLEGDELIGGVALKNDEIDDLFVAPKYQGHGYGKQILLWALEHIDTKHVILHVSAWNEKARSMYENTGFEITETIEID